jgi:hypothetical protein
LLSAFSSKNVENSHPWFFQLGNQKARFSISGKRIKVGAFLKIGVRLP